MKRLPRTHVGPLLGLLALAAGVPLTAGCDTFEPQLVPFGDTVALYSLARPEYIGLPSAMDFFSPQPVVVESLRLRGPDDFDAAFSEIDGGFVFLPAGMFDTFDIRPGIVRAESGVSFDGLERAPRDGYVIDAPVPLEVGGVYAVRSRSDGRSCVRYGKFEVLELDPDGLLEFRFLRNNLCNDRRLILPELPDEE